MISKDLFRIQWKVPSGGMRQKAFWLLKADEILNAHSALAT